MGRKKTGKQIYTMEIWSVEQEPADAQVYTLVSDIPFDLAVDVLRGKAFMDDWCAQGSYSRVTAEPVTYNTTA